MTAVSNNDIAHAIYGFMEDKSRGDLNSTLKSVVNFLNKRRLLSKAPEILKKLEEIINLKEDRLAVKVISARNLDEKMKEELKSLLIKKYKNKEVTLTERIDQNLVGGVRLEIKDEVIDLTLRKQLERLQEHLTVKQR